MISSPPNAIPVANAGPDQTVPRNSLIRLDGTASYDPEAAPIGFLWTIVSRPPESSAPFDNAASPSLRQAPGGSVRSPSAD